MDYTRYELLWLFLIYSFSGWILEAAFAATKRKRFINKGFLNAPFCAIYGFAAVAFALFLPELTHRIFFLFLGGALIASFLEYCSGRILERIFHQKWWDYSDQKWNIEGYVCLRYSLLWGLGAVLMMKFTNPLLTGMINLVPTWIGKIILWVILIVLILDAIGTSAALLQLHSNLKRINQISEDLQKLSDSIGNAVTKRIQSRMMHAYPNIELKHLIETRVSEVKAPSKRFAEGCGFYKLTALFLIGSFLGDVVETIFCYATSGIWMSRSSVVYGPFSIVWGLGCVLLTVFLYRYRDGNDRHIFIAGTILGGAYEYICSVFTELVFGTVFWDYSSIPFNLGGRINLLYCFFWGIAAVVWMKLIYPFFSKWIEKIPMKTGVIGSQLFIVFMIFNMILSGLAMARYSVRQNNPEAATTELGAFLDERFPDERIERIYPNVIIVD